ncbi:hypothetical protein KCU90_g2975, partial [Aureobasidium melanogenum]
MPGMPPSFRPAVRTRRWRDPDAGAVDNVKREALFDADDYARRLEDRRRRFAACKAETIDAFIGDDRGDLRATRADGHFRIHGAFGDCRHGTGDAIARRHLALRHVDHDDHRRCLDECERLLASSEAERGRAAVRDDRDDLEAALGAQRDFVVYRAVFDFGDFAGELIARAGLHVVLLVEEPREKYAPRQMDRI